MRFITRFRPSPALVVASVALLASLAGTGVAAVTLIAPNSVASQQVVDGSLLKQDFKAGQLPSGKRGARGPTGPPGSNATSTATFASVRGAAYRDVAGFQKVLSKNLSAGSWAITAAVNVFAFSIGKPDVSETVCELRNGSVAIGGGRGRASTTLSATARYLARYSLSMNGGAQVPEGGGEVSVWCMDEQLKGVSNDAAMVMIKVDRFS